VERRGTLVTRAELVALGWPGSLPSVAEQSLNTCICQIRRVLRVAETARAVLDTGLAAFPGSAPMHAEWAEIGVWLADYDGAARGAEKALALDRRSATAHRTRAVLAMLRSDWAAAESELHSAASIDPGDTRTHTTLAWLRLIQGRFADADRLLREAVEVDPMSATLYRDAGLGYLLMGRYEEAERYCRDVLRFKPGSRWATDCLFDVMVLSGRIPEAAHWGRRLLALYDSAPPPDDVPAVRAVAIMERWRLDRWIEAVDRGAYPFGLALAYAANGRRDEAVGALRSAAESPRLGLLTISTDPRLASLREHPGFRALEARLRLPA